MTWVRHFPKCAFNAKGRAGFDHCTLCGQILGRESRFFHRLPGFFTRRRKSLLGLSRLALMSGVLLASPVVIDCSVVIDVSAPAAPTSVSLRKKFLRVGLLWAERFL